MKRSPRDVFLLLRMSGWAALLPVLKLALPLPRLVALMASPRPRSRSRAREYRIAELAQLLYRRRERDVEDTCLERSLVTYRYLGRVGADPSLVVAFGREQRDVIGHVWVTVDGTAVHDPADSLERYVPLLAFRADGARVAVPAAPE